MTDFEREQLERCWPWLAAAAILCGETHRKQDVINAIESGAAQFWPLPHSAVVTSIDVYPTGKKQLRGWLAGGNIAELKDIEPQLCEWAKSQGCDAFTIVGRRGWLKALDGYREAATLLTKDLR